MALSGKTMGMSTLLALGCVLLSMADAGGFRRYFRMRQEILDIQDRNRRSTELNARLRHKIQALRDDPEALEQAAREDLGFVRPGEIVLNLE